MSEGSRLLHTISHLLLTSLANSVEVKQQKEGEERGGRVEEKAITNGLGGLTEEISRRQNQGQNGGIGRPKHNCMGLRVLKASPVRLKGKEKSIVWRKRGLRRGRQGARANQ